MKRITKRYGLAAITSACAAATMLAFAPAHASAFDPTHDDYSPDDMPATYFALKQMKPMDVMHQMDAGKKGYVTKAEFLKYMGALYDRMDRDKNDKVTADEWLKNIWNSP